MTLKSIREQYLSGQLTKPQYIQEMHKVHSSLYDYAEFLKNTDIAKIEIQDGAVIMTSRSNQVKMYCDPSDQRIAPIEILNFGNYEKKDADLMAALVKPGYSILDIGANYGWYSISLSKQVSGLKIYAFEPIPKTFSYLKKNIELNQLKNIEVFNFGFSNKKEELTFYFYPEGSGNASLANLSERTDAEKITCQVQKLDDYMKSNPVSVDFIKCDVEGAELFVFEGGVQTIQKHKPIVFTEMLRKWAAKFNYHPNQIIQLMTEMGYHCFSSVGNSLMKFEKMDDSTVETNFFFLHQEKHHEQISQFKRK